MSQEEIECKYLDLKNVETICYSLARALFDSKENPMAEFAYLNKNIMLSAIDSPRQSFYETLFEKAGTLGFQIIKGHALLDGNKRLGITTTLVFLLVNGHTIDVKNGELVPVALDVATGKMSKQNFILWLEQNSRKTKRFRFSF